MDTREQLAVHFATPIAMRKTLIDALRKSLDTDPVYWLDWNGEDLLKTNELARRCLEAIEICQKTESLSDLRVRLSAEAQRLMESLLDHPWRASSTSPMTNLRKAQEAEAIAEFATILRLADRWFE